MSLSNFFKAFLKPFASPYRALTGYHQLGLRYDDLVQEENEIVQEALRRLPEQEANERMFRIRRAMQTALRQEVLPKNQWTKAEEDKRYLSPLIEQVSQELQERKDYENGVFQ